MSTQSLQNAASTNPTVNRENTCNGRQVENQAWRRPSYNVAESDDAYEVEVALPGVSREGIDINIVDDLLTITGARETSFVDKDGWRSIRREIPEGNFRLNLQLNAEVEEKAIKASVVEGVLKVALPKAEDAKPRKIEIS